MPFFSLAFFLFHFHFIFISLLFFMEITKGMTRECCVMINCHALLMCKNFSQKNLQIWNFLTLKIFLHSIHHRHASQEPSFLHLKLSSLSFLQLSAFVYSPRHTQHYRNHHTFAYTTSDTDDDDDVCRWLSLFIFLIFCRYCLVDDDDEGDEDNWRVVETLSLLIQEGERKIS